MIKTYGHRSCEGVCVRFLPPGGAAAGLWLWWVGGSRLGVCLDEFVYFYLCVFVGLCIFVCIVCTGCLCCIVLFVVIVCLCAHLCLYM